MKKPKDKPFSRLSQAGKRIAIAKDVIAQIKSKLFNIETGKWARVDIIDDNDMVDKQSLLAGGLPRKFQCNCCAVGAAFLSSIRLFNVASFDADSEVQQFDAFNQLATYFDRDQLKMIEEAFELGGGACSTNSRDETVKFGDRYDDETKRALAIFTNIVKNRGTFKP